MIHLDDCAIGGTFVVRRDIALELEGFPSVRYGDDALFHEKAQRQGVVIASTDAKTYIYNRESEDSLCTIVEQDGLGAVERRNKSSAI
jgi:hypothetical protein